MMKKNQKKRTSKQVKIRRFCFIFFVILLLLSNLILIIILTNYNLIVVYHDVDRRDNGNTFICISTLGEVFNHQNRIDNQIPVEKNSPHHKIVEVNKQGKVVWDFFGLAFSHELLQLDNNHILVADTAYDRIIEINYPNKDIIWSWEPAKIDWSKVNPKWDNDHYYNNPLEYEWTHLNDVEYKNYGTWEACLISIRNFDLIVEINYTAEKIGPSNDPDNIVWYFGDFEDYSLLRQQHNPDYLENGNIIVSDSENDRIIEIDYNTKKIIWKFDTGLSWPRDADELPNGNIMITDTFHNRIIEISKEDKEIIWSYKGDLFVPYEADRLDNGNTIISNGYGGVCFEINEKGQIIWRYGISFEKSIIYMNLIIISAILSCAIIFQYKKMKKSELNHKGKKKIKIHISILSVL